MRTTNRPAADLNEICRALELLFEPGQVIELRALNTVTSAYRRPHTVSGYFDDLPKLASRAAELSGDATGVYVTLNEVNPALLARAANRTRDMTGQDPATSDSDVIRRRWLLIDIDPIRPSNISSTEEEHDAAQAVAREIRTFLIDEGWPEPVLADSGNGAHVLCQIELPTDDGGLVKRTLEALAFKFSFQGIGIDVTVSNPARISRLYGTLTAKGDHTEERPHRLSRLLEAPTRVEVVPIQRLQDLAGNMPVDSGYEQGDYGAKGFDVGEWIRHHKLDVIGPSDWHGGTKWIFRLCPWNSFHTNRSAYVVQLSNGSVAAGCHHNGCADKEWLDLRSLVDPGWSSRGDDESETPAWEIPLPFEAVAAPPFPTDAFPQPVAAYTYALSEALQVPEDLVGCLVLGVGAAAAAGRVRIQLNADWSEPLNLFVVAALASGERKSPTFRSVAKPLNDRERELAKAAESEIAIISTQAEILERSLQETKSAAAKSKDQAGRKKLATEAEQLAVQLAGLAIPVTPRLIADDATSEAVTSLLYRQDGRLAVMSTEGGLFETMAGRYSDRVLNVDVYLKGYSGDPLRVDRKGRPSEFIASPKLTLCLTVQPEVIRDLAGKKGFRGRGLLGRFLYSLPSGRLGFRNNNPTLMSGELVASWDRILRKVLDLPDPAEGDSRSILLSDGAHELFQQYRDRVEAQLRPGSELDDTSDWGAKLPGQVARIAGILHMFENAEGGEPSATPLQLSSMKAAIRLGDYFADHAKAAFSLMGADGSMEAAKRLWARIERNGLPQFTLRDLWQNVRRGFTVAQVGEALVLLGSLGYVRRAPDERRPGAGRPGSPRFEVNPMAWTHNPHNSALIGISEDATTVEHSQKDVVEWIA